MTLRLQAFQTKKREINMKKIEAIIERGKDGEYSAFLDCDELEYGVNGQGTTLQEAKEDLQGVYEAMRSLYAAEGRKFTEVEWTYRVDYASLLQYYAQFFTLVGLSKLTGINKGQLSHYINGTSRPGRATVEKLRAGFGRLAADIDAMTL